jgi:RimJ/RimL family protein N-acetyltransferase
MESIRLRTTRLEVISATIEMARAERDDPARLERDFGIRLGRPWPPPLNDEASLAWSISVLEANKGTAGWGFWYFTLPNEEGSPSLAVGNGGFKGPPDADGTIEVGYSVLEEYQRRGYASEAVGALIAWGFAQAGVRRVIAETYPELIGSIGVLRKLGFQEIPEGGSEPGVIRFERRS